ncbi:MAG: hypothetical protein VYD90_12185 [Pseudomonadota bacterium]|nr:hypothetical protein [Pseudomonadota bacterium]
MKTIDTLAAMAANLPASACKPMRTILADLSDHWDRADIEQVSFAHLFDSPVFLIEAIEELAHVRSFDEIGGERVSVLASASAAFDIAHWTEDGAFAVLGTIETANGGPQFYIPKAIADQAPEVDESVRLKAQEVGEEA